MCGDLGTGDLVECVETDCCSPPLITAGTIYRVSGVSPAGRCDCMVAHRPWAFDHIGLDLADAPPPAPGLTWCGYMFRPISRRSDFEAILEQLKTPRDDVSEPSELVPATA